MYSVFSFHVCFPIMALLKRALPTPRGLGMSAPCTQEPEKQSLLHGGHRGHTGVCELWDASTQPATLALSCSLLCGKPPTGTDPSIPWGFTRLQGSSGGEKKTHPTTSSS